MCYPSDIRLEFQAPDLLRTMPSNSLHSPLSSGEELLFHDGNAELDDVYNEQNDHKKSKHRKHGKHKSKKHKKHRSSSSHNLNPDEDGASIAQQSSRSHRKHKSKHHHQYESDEETFDSKPPPPPQPLGNALRNAKPSLVAGVYDDLSDTEPSFKDDRMVSSGLLFVRTNACLNLMPFLMFYLPPNTRLRHQVDRGPNRENDILKRLPSGSPVSSSSLDENLKSPKNENRAMDLYDEELGTKKMKRKHSKHKHRKHGCKKHKRSHLERHSSELGKFGLLCFALLIF